VSSELQKYFGATTVAQLCNKLNGMDGMVEFFKSLGSTKPPDGPVKNLSVALRGYKPLPPCKEKDGSGQVQLPYLSFFSTLPRRFQDSLASFAFKVLNTDKSNNGVFTHPANIRLFSQNAGKLTDAILRLQRDINEAMGHSVPLTVISLGGSPSYLAAHSMNILSQHKTYPIGDADPVFFAERELMDMIPVEQGFLHLPFSGNWFEEPVDGVYPERAGKLPSDDQFKDAFNFYDTDLGLKIEDLTAKDRPFCILEQTKTGRGLKSSLDMLERWVIHKFGSFPREVQTEKLENLRTNIRVIAFQDPLNQAKYPLSNMQGLHHYNIKVIAPVEDSTRQATHDFEGIADNDDGPRLVPSYKPYDHDSNMVRGLFKRDRELSTSVMILVTYHLVRGYDALERVMRDDRSQVHPVIDLGESNVHSTKEVVTA
jgi:hypothetical protein